MNVCHITQIPESNVCASIDMEWMNTGSHTEENMEVDIGKNQVSNLACYCESCSTSQCLLYQHLLFVSPAIALLQSVTELKAMHVYAKNQHTSAVLPGKTKSESCMLC